jgi:hypothetical protein
MTTVPTNLGSRAKSNLLQLLARLGRILQSAIGASNTSLVSVRVQPRSRRRR